MNQKQALETIGGSLSKPSKMPGLGYGLPAQQCRTGGRLRKMPGSVCDGCYAMRGNYRFENVRRAQMQRARAVKSPLWAAAMVTVINRSKVGHFRWHDSGDLQNVEHLRKICDVARATPTVAHWLPTKELGTVRAYLDSGEAIPGNLVVRVSAYFFDGTATLSPDLIAAGVRTSSSHHKGPALGKVCPAPTQGGRCEECRDCWDRDVSNVSYHKH